MKKLLIIIGLIAILGFISVCDDTGLNPTAISPVTLKFGQSMIVNPTGLQIMFTDLIQENRCPEDVVCIWPGMAEIELRVITQVRDTHFVVLPITGGQAVIDSLAWRPIDTLGYRFTLQSLLPYPISDVVVPMLAYEAILSVEISDSGDPVDSKVIITDLSPGAIQVRPWTYDTVFVDDDKLELSGTYSGGCQTHYFRVYMSPPGFPLSLPPQADLYVRHESLPDFCEAIIHWERTISLEPVIDLYRQQFGQEGEILLNLYHYFDDQPAAKTQVRYVPEQTHSQ